MTQVRDKFTKPTLSEEPQPVFKAGNSLPCIDDDAGDNGGLPDPNKAL